MFIAKNSHFLFKYDSNCKNIRRDKVIVFKSKKGKEIREKSDM